MKRKKNKKCPKCGLINPISAIQRDCGYILPVKNQRFQGKSDFKPTELEKELYNKQVSWGQILDILRAMFGDLELEFIREDHDIKDKEKESEIIKMQSGILIITRFLAENIGLNQEDIQKSVVYLQKVAEELYIKQFED